jgi:archaeal flagellin FlaB
MMSFSMNEHGFTGLEAAIVLIAFVVVAAVFSYVVLGAGFFTTQTAQATVHTGVDQASSSLEIVGNVIGVAIAATPVRLTYINVSVATTAGGTSMDLSQMVISYSDSSGVRNPSLLTNTGGMNSCYWVQVGDTNILAYDSTANLDDYHWCVSQKINDLNPSSPNNLLEPNEIWILSIAMPPSATVNTKVTVNLQPAVGAVLPISRTVPGAFSRVQTLY